MKLHFCNFVNLALESIEREIVVLHIHASIASVIRAVTLLFNWI